jgi:hypothetical protein
MQPFLFPMPFPDRRFDRRNDACAYRSRSADCRTVATLSRRKTKNAAPSSPQKMDSSKTVFIRKETANHPARNQDTGPRLEKIDLATALVLCSRSQVHLT